METKTAFIQTDDNIRIHYERTGGEKPPLVLSHGITDNGRCMLRLAGHLADRFDVIMVDARGHGLSGAPEDGYSADHHAADLYQLITKLGLQRPVIYGHSMGARTTARIAARYPDLPRAIVLEDPVYIIPMTEAEIAAGKVWLQQLPVEIEQRKKLSEAERLELARGQDHADWTPAEQIEWARSKAQVSPNVAKVGRTMGSIVDDFPKITCPVLILKADAEPKIQQKQEASVARIPDSQIIHVAGAGHNIRRDNWAATIKHLDRFLENLS